MKLIKTYKLFEMDQNENLFALFIGKNKTFQIGQWLKAEILPTKGFSIRPGFHSGEIPSAPWLMSANGCYKSQRSKYWKRVWAECEIIADNDYTEEALKTKKKCFEDRLPQDGYYLFKEAGLNRVWYISDRIKINRVLTEDERQQILNSFNYNEQEAAEPYIQAIRKRMKNTK
jgi:hypothetical protein